MYMEKSLNIQMDRGNSVYPFNITWWGHKHILNHVLGMWLVNATFISFEMYNFRI